MTPTTEPATGGTRTKPASLHERVRASVRTEVTDVALRLFTNQGFDRTTAEQIASEAGLSRATLFRYFGTKEDIVLDGLEGDGQHVAESLADRPEGERPWAALRRAFDVLVAVNEQDPPRALTLLRLLQETPSLRARHLDKQLLWQEQLAPEVAKRLDDNQWGPDDPRATALVASALGCLDAAARAWVAHDGSVSLADLLDRAMSSLTDDVEPRP